MEIGEIQAALLRIPDISAAAVIPVGEGSGARLVGFYVSEYELALIDLHDLLSAWLPEYMVPAHHFRLAGLPLDENGKLDRPRLKRMAEELATGVHSFEPPGSEAEQQLATLWAEVLQMAAGQVGRHDNFFHLGGTSLAAIHLLLRLNHQLSLTDILTRPVLKDQAHLLAAAGGASRALLLHELSVSGAEQPVLVCLPDAGGNAINFRHLADTAAGRAQVMAVELPGHDLARPGEELVTLPRLADRLARELAGRPGLYLWGQGAGAAAALATAQALEQAGTKVAGVMVAWDDIVLGDAAWGSPENISDDEVVDRLCRRRAYVEVDAAMAGWRSWPGPTGTTGPRRCGCSAGWAAIRGSAARSSRSCSARRPRGCARTSPRSPVSAWPTWRERWPGTIPACSSGSWTGGTAGAGCDRGRAPGRLPAPRHRPGGGGHRSRHLRRTAAGRTARAWGT